MSPIFITGHIKTGTSLMAALLDNHPELIVFPEEMFLFSKLNRIKKRGSPTFNEFWNSFFNDVQIKKMFGDESEGLFGNADYSNFDANEFKKLCVNSSTDYAITKNHLIVFYKKIFESYLSVMNFSNDKRWVEKTPMNEFNFFYWKHFYPHCKFIYMRRNPLEVFSSIKKKRSIEDIDYSIYNFITKYKTSNTLADHLELKYPRNFKIIQLEDLKSNSNTVNEIISFLSVEYNDTFKIPTKMGKEWRGNSMFSGNKTHGINNKSYENERKKIISDNEKKKIENLIINNKKPIYDFSFLQFNYLYYLKVIFIDLWVKRFLRGKKSYDSPLNLME